MNSPQACESDLQEREQALLADESLSPAFRHFINTWARKIEGGDPRPAFVGIPVLGDASEACHS